MFKRICWTTSDIKFLTSHVTSPNCPYPIKFHARLLYLFCAHPYIASTFAMSPFHPFWRRPIYHNILSELLLKRWRTTPYVLRYALLEKSTMTRVFGWRYSTLLKIQHDTEDTARSSETLAPTKKSRRRHNTDHPTIDIFTAVKTWNAIMYSMFLYVYETWYSFWKIRCLTCLRNEFIMGCGKYTTRKLIFLLPVIAWVIKWKPLARSYRIVRGDAVFQEIWNSSLHWRRQVVPPLPSVAKTTSRLGQSWVRRREWTTSVLFPGLGKLLAVAPCTESHAFESRRGDPLSWVRLLWLFQMFPAIHIKIDHD
jgi:hypothetical protein